MHDKSGGRGKRKRIIKEKAYYERIKRRLRRKNTRKYTHTTEKERERKEREKDAAISRREIYYAYLEKAF